MPQHLTNVQIVAVSCRQCQVPLLLKPFLSLSRVKFSWESSSECQADIQHSKQAVLRILLHLMSLNEKSIGSFKTKSDQQQIIFLSVNILSCNMQTNIISKDKDN